MKNQQVNSLDQADRAANLQTFFGSGRKQSKKRLLVIVLILIVAIVGGLVAWWFVSHKAITVEKLTPKSTAQEAQIQASDLVEKSLQNKNDGVSKSDTSVKQTKVQLSQLEKDAKSKAVKQVYSGAIVDLYQQATDLTAARDAAAKANDNYGTAFTAAHLAGVYEQQGNYKEAASYYKQAVERSPKTGQMERSAYNDYRYKQEEMEQQR